MQWPPDPPVANPVYQALTIAPNCSGEESALAKYFSPSLSLDKEIQTSVLSTSTYTYLTHELARKSGSEICMHTHTLSVPSPGREQAASPWKCLGPNQICKCVSSVSRLPLWRLTNALLQAPVSCQHTRLRNLLIPPRDAHAKCLAWTGILVMIFKLRGWEVGNTNTASEQPFTWAIAEIKMNFFKTIIPTLISEIPSGWLQKSHCCSQQWQNHT